MRTKRSCVCLTRTRARAAATKAAEVVANGSGRAHAGSWDRQDKEVQLNRLSFERSRSHDDRRASSYSHISKSGCVGRTRIQRPSAETAASIRWNARRPAPFSRDSCIHPWNARRPARFSRASCIHPWNVWLAASLFSPEHSARVKQIRLISSCYSTAGDGGGQAWRSSKLCRHT
jgi:hypothetical protein